jgi:bla regulator protein blaR1
MIGELTNHLWQSTLFAIIAAALTFAFRGNRAHIRYWLWFSASFKFFLPFSLLMSLGSHLKWPSIAHTVAARITPPAAAFTMEQVTQQFPGGPAFVSAAETATDSVLIAIVGVWACGFVAITLLRLRSWRRIRDAVRSSIPIDVRPFEVPQGVDIRCSPGLLEPGVAGFLHPILLLPAGLMERLTKPQLDAVLAHELCHVRRRDNLFAAIHMIVEAIFWFHPLVWWIGAQLLAERERACDEDVLTLVGEPRIYAEGILNVCKHCVESPLMCLSGVTGGNLKRRIEAIMTNRIGQRLNRANKFLLASAAVAALAGPLLIGVGNAPAVQAQRPADTPRQFDVAAIKPNNSGANVLGIRVVPGGGLRAVNATLRSLISEAYQVRDFEVSGGPAWLDSARYDIEAKGPLEPGSHEQTGLQIMKMLQALLADRFQLRIHRETKEMPIYALLVAKNGPKLERPREACFDPAAGAPPPPTLPGQSPSRPCGGFNNSSNQMLGASVAVSRFAANLSRFTGRTVVDRTGLKGTFDIALRWTPDEGQAFLAPTQPASADDSRPSIFTAVQEQLGLRLEAQRGPVEVLVIDHAEKPSGN